MLTQTDALGNITAYEYDNLGRLVKTTAPDGAVTRYEYSSAGKLVKTIDAYGNETRYFVNGNGFDTGTRDPLGNSTSTVYNEQNLAGFVRTKDLNKTDIYHAKMDCLQQYGGYNAFYDGVFDHVTDMDHAIFEFISGGQAYRLWAWKGDYLNLGAGAEMGIYKQLNIKGQATPQWLVDQNLSMHMTLQLYYKGDMIINWDPEEDNNYKWNKLWWITGFNPYYTNVDARDLRAEYTVTFNDKTMYTDFYNKFGCSVDADPRWKSWFPENYSVIFRF